MRRRGTGVRGPGTEPCDADRVYCAPRPGSGTRHFDNRPLGITGVSFLNARPLVAGLEAAIAAPFIYTYRSLPPTECAAEFASGHAIASLVPVGSLPFLPPLQIVPSLGVACRGEVRSVLLVSKVEANRIRRLAAHRVSGTSVALAQTLLLAQWGARVEVVKAAPPLATMLEGVDATVIIGDPALAICGRTGLLEIDLGAAWLAWTGMPFVFAVWGLAPQVPQELAELLLSSYSYTQAHWEQLIAEWAVAHDFSRGVVRDYLESKLVHALSERERAGMTLFLEQAAASGVLPRYHPEWLDTFVPTVGTGGVLQGPLAG